MHFNKRLYLVPALFLLSMAAVAQQIEFTYQAGLTSAVKRIIPVPGSNTMLVAERNGDIIAWDISVNKILCKVISSNTEIADVVYCEKEKKILVAGQEGIEVFDASKLLTDHIIHPDFHYTSAGVSSLYWNEPKNLLRAATQKGEIITFPGINALRENKPSATFTTGINAPFAIREIGQRICVLGIQQQAFYNASNGKLLFSAKNYCTGMYGHAFSDKDSAIYLPREAALIKLTYTKDLFRTTTHKVGKNDEGSLVLGITTHPGTGQVFVGTNQERIFAMSPLDNTLTEVFNSPDGSFTSLLIHSDKMLVGDFFGNMIVLDVATKRNLFQLNEDATPSLNGVYLDKNSRMVSTHFGLRGFAVKIWDIPNANLSKSFNIRGNIAYNVMFEETSDTIFSGHTDGGIYRYYKKGEQYIADTLELPERTFMYGSIFLDLELDKKSRRDKIIKEFTDMLGQPGILAFPADTLNNTELVFVNHVMEVPDECKAGKLPSNYRIPEACLAAADLAKETLTWDILDRDLFYMRACNAASADQFLQAISNKGIDTVKAARYFRIVRGLEKTQPFFYLNDKTSGDNRTLHAFSNRGKPLYADISLMPEMALFFYTDSVVAWNARTNTSTAMHTGMKNMDFYYDFNEHYVAIGDDRSGTISLLRIPEKARATKWISFGEEDYLVHNADGYYKIRGRSNRINFSIDKKPLSFSSFDLKYNRPDLVIQEVGSGDSALIAAYRSASLKRIKRSGLNVSSMPGEKLPEVDFANRGSITYNQTNELLELRLKGRDSAAVIDRFNVWVNEVPVFGSNGYSVRAGKKHELDTTLQIQLSRGENRLEASIVNINGTESYRKPLIVNYESGSAGEGSLRFIGIGIDQFKDAKHNLLYSVKDIRDLSIKLKEKYGDNIIIDTLFNEQVIISNVKALKKKLEETRVNDKVIIAYSGHGLLSSDFDYYLSTYNVNFDNPGEHGLPYDELENLLDSIPARKKLMLIDACHSGEVDKEDLVMMDVTADTLIKGLRPVAYKKEGQLGLKNSFELMQSLFVNLGKSTGATIISAAAGTQFALERNDLENGVFTYSILEAMNKYPTMKISALKKMVGERVEELTRGLQKPTSRSETIAVDWEVW